MVLSSLSFFHPFFYETHKKNLKLKKNYYEKMEARKKKSEKMKETIKPYIKSFLQFSSKSSFRN